MSDEDPASGSERETDGVHPLHQLNLTPEERAVLLQCRRNSMIRGIVAGSGVTMLLYWFRGQGLVPSAINRFPAFFYTMGFFGAFMAGCGSYQKICYQKIMSLENSSLKTATEEYEKAFKNKVAKRRANFPETDYNPERFKKAPPSMSVPKKNVQPPPSPNTGLQEGPSFNLKTYNRDKSMMDTKESSEDQPDAFSGEVERAPVQFSNSPQENTRKRTFDEIREANRLRNSQQQSPTSRQSPDVGARGNERKKRNKYGDVIEP